MARRHGWAVALATAACLALLGCGGGDPQVPDTPDGTITAVTAALADGKPQVLWTAMPASYQKDVSGLVHDFAGKMDPELYGKGVAVAKKLVAVLRDKRDFILGHPMLAMAKVKADELKPKWDTVVGLVETLVNSELGSLDKLKTLDVGAFLRGTGATLMADAAELSKVSPDDPYEKEFAANLRGVKVEIIKAEAESATVKVTHPDKSSKEMELVRVEGKWVPKEMVDDWAEMMANARKQLAGMGKEMKPESKAQALAMMAVAESALDQLLKADTQEKFNAALQGAMGMFMGGMGPEPLTPPTPPTPPVPPRPTTATPPMPPAPRPGTR